MNKPASFLTERSLTRPKVLLVEDDDGDAMAVQRAFQRAKAPVPIVRATDGIQALEILRGSNRGAQPDAPRVLIVDLNMPRMGGIQLLKALRADDDLKRSIVFILTTSKLDEDKTAAYDLNVAGYVLKATAGENFPDFINMLTYYLRIVEFPYR